MANKKYFVGIDLQKNELQNGVIHKLSTAPSNPVEGQIYYNDVEKELKIYDGTAWITTGADELTVAADSTAFVTISNGELSFNNLAITGVTVDTTETSLANFITANYTVGNEFQEGDMIILTNATDQTQRSWIHNGGTAVDANDFTRLQTDLDMASVRAEFVGGDALTYTQSTGTFDVNVDNSSIKIVGDALTVDGDVIGGQLAGDGLVYDATNNELDINVDNSTLEVSVDVLQIKDGGIATSKLADNSITNAKMADDSVGTAEIIDGNITEAKLSTALQSRLNNNYKETFGDGTTIVHTITHGLNTKDVMTQIYDVTTGACIECDVIRNTVNTVQVTANPAIATNNARILVKKIED